MISSDLDLSGLDAELDRLEVVLRLALECDFTAVVASTRSDLIDAVLPWLRALADLDAATADRYRRAVALTALTLGTVH